MHGAFDDKEPGKFRQERDTELTLSSTTLLGIFFGMVLLCGLFFGLGFAVGRYGPSDSVAKDAGTGTSGPATVEASTKPKPSPTTQSMQPQPAAAVERAQPANGEPTEGEIVVKSPSSNASATALAVNQQPQVKAAFPVAPDGAAPPTQGTVQPALPQPGALMVQIAAVAHPEDAEVLLGALRKRGYAVSARRLPTDNLIHVQIGPFSSRDEAYGWRQRLLNDGYNAIVQP